ncbi:hypothetical protein [Mesorhizobium sp. BH1-1-4]|uniref:hypothetical protein n=1 Tax=Mesorhizobium sp. BH1-1-4 TaxID=2876662 RepID=UPI001CD0ACB3|nr:hypothetical protein [Mesorhizobium sp. BH1-1-4]MBZ9996580.1 hypothetical protein [Mesorhizobium sp. BH1-1-4]
MNDLKDYTLAEFLADQSTNFRSALPLVHSSESKNLITIIREGKISVTRCDTFTDENLAYFFHGRPSYRKTYDKPKDWQLPFVLLLKNACVVNMRRIFPFDSGAFFSGRFPNYLSDFKPEGYELAPQGNAAIDLLIDIFFGNDSDYLHGKAKPVAEVKQRRRLGIAHSEIEALCTMYNRDQVTADDRSLAIEVQSASDVSLSDHLIGIVMPRPYFDDKALKKRLRTINKGLHIRHYDIYALSTESYMATIYGLVKDIYRKIGLIDA